MGDDPLIPGVSNSASHGSSNANNYFISNIGKPSFTILVVGVGLAVGIGVGALVTGQVRESHYRFEMQAVLAQQQRTERELRMTEYYLNILNTTLNEQGVTKPEQNYLQFKKEHGDGER